MHVSKILMSAVALSTVVTANAAFGAAFTVGNLVVSRVGDGTNALANSGGAISLLEFTSSGASAQSAIGITSTGTSGLQWSGTATSEGAISLSGDGAYVTVAGYNPGAGGFTGSGSLSGRTSTQAPRGFGVVSVAGGTFAFGGTFSGTSATYTGNNIRSAVATTSGGFYYGAGGVHGTVRSDGTNAGTVIQSSTTANTRVVNIQNGNLYFSSQNTVIGIYGFSGIPTTSTSPTAIISGVTGQGTAANDFAFSPNGNIAYVADAVAGVQKFTKSGSTWSLAYNITTATNGLTGLGVDWSKANPIIYAVNPTDLFKYTDTGVGGVASSIATAGTNYAFRGLEVIPEPGSMVIVVAAGAASLLRRRSKRV